VHVRLVVASLALDPRDGAAVLLLEHEETHRVFPLWLGDREAASIARAADGVIAHRPEASSLMHGVVRALGGVVRQVSITGVVGGVVQAEVVLAQADEEVVLDARPSDAIALALQAGAPVLIDDALLEQVAARVREAEARVQPEQTFTAAEPVHQSAAERWNALIGHLSGSRTHDDDVYEA
jgi:bifunctional DNase/RNase